MLLFGVAASSRAQETSSSGAATPGHIEFDHPGAAQASVEVDLTQDMFGDLFGIGDAVLAGVAEALAQSPQAQQGSQAIQMAAERAAAARELVSIAKNVINDVRVRVYEGVQSDSSQPADVAAHYDQQLTSGGWDQAVRVREGDKGVRVSVLRDNGAIKGLFVVAAEQHNLVLVNLTCDISPENVKKLAAAATKSGLEAGLGDKIEKAMKHMK